MARELTNVTQVSGPLVIVEGIPDAAYGEVVEVILPSGESRLGQVLESRTNLAIVQVFGGTEGIDTQRTSVRFTGEILRLGVSSDLLGRIFDGKGDPIDGAPKPIPEEKLPISGSAINPYARAYPREFIQTGITAIDLMNTLVRGQKLPFFTGSGLPHNLIAAQVARQAKVLGKEEEFGVVFAAMGITHEEASFFIRDFESTGAIERLVGFINLADDPAMERIITPQLALTAAEYLAFEHDLHMLVILIDMLKFAESLREISAARGEIPGRRGFPGYLYTTLATIYERAGRIGGRKGSITQMPILTMPGDDLTHPVPDLSGYICEGQLILSRDLHLKGIYPPIDVLPSLSRLMREGIGKGRTREDHRFLSDQLYAAYAEGRDMRALASIVGVEALTSRDRLYLEFADKFERKLVAQGLDEDRDIQQSLDLGWELLSMLPEADLYKIPPELLERYHPKHRAQA